MKKYLFRCLNSAKILLFPILMVLILGPMEVYNANITDFNFLLKDFIYTLLLCAILLLIVGSALISFIPNKAFNVVSCIIFDASILLYIQNMILNKKIANADGSPMNWGEMKSYTTLNTIVWCVFFVVIIIVLFFACKKFSDIRSVTIISLIMSFFQIVAIIMCIVQINNSGRNFNDYHVNGRDQFCVAKNDNVIILIADSAQTNLFSEMYDKDTSIADGLEDFTYYDNYESCYSGTYPSVLCMLTGAGIDVKYTRLENAENAWNSEKSKRFFDSLHKNNYTCNLYAACWLYEFGNAEPMLDSIDNIDIAERHISKELLATMMFKYSAYRYAPYIIKPRLEVVPESYRSVAYYDDEIVDYDVPFYEKLKDVRLSINDTWDNAFIVQHLEGMHPPISVAADVTYDDNATEEDQMRAVFVIMNEYLDQLKELDLYDNSTIIIMADHGNQIYGPIFFIKNRNEKHDKMIINSSPISAEDFQATILSIIGEKHSNYGSTIFEWDENDKRERKRFSISSDDYYFNLYGHTYTGDARYIDDYDLYDIELIGVK